MINPEDRSRAFNFALFAQETFGKIIGVVILWSIWAILFSTLDNIFISVILLTCISIGFGTITPLIDFNESHATNPLWTGHARFHLVWQVNAMILTSLLSLILLWFFFSKSNVLIVLFLNYLWIFSFFATMISMRLYDGELNDINGVPSIKNKILGRTIEVDRNVQAISGVLILNTYALVLFLI